MQALLCFCIAIFMPFIVSQVEGIAIINQNISFDYSFKQEKTVLSPQFKFLEMGLSQNGVIELKDVTPLSTSENLITRTRLNPQQPYQKIRISNTDTPVHDFIDLGRKTSEAGLIMKRQKSNIGPVVGEPEVLVLLDYANYMLFNGDSAAMNDYLSVFYHAVNSRFATIQDPKITVTVSGVLAFNSREVQSFFEQGMVSDGTGYDIGIVLDKLSQWVYASQAFLPPFDIVSLISGEAFKMKDGKGGYVNGVGGLAYLAGACWSNGNRFLGVSVNADHGGFWDGVMTASHELAHSLNSPHDGDLPGSTSCPWYQGYIMSYLGYGTKNKFYFSECTQNQMKSFIQSQSGSCVTEFQSPDSLILSNENPGDRLNMTAQCQKHLNRLDTMVETEGRSPQELCLNLKCRVPYKGEGAVPGSYLIYTMNRIPGEGSSCGENMICKDGDCVSLSF